jgi:DNA-binding CsgD family transcriptional regulator
MKHFILFYEIICFASGLPVIALIIADYIRKKLPMLKYLLLYVLTVSIQLVFANILYYREINFMYPVTYAHLLLTIGYFLSEAAFIFVGPALISHMIQRESKIRNRVFLALAVLSAIVIVSPYFIEFNPVSRAMKVLPGIIAYRILLYAVCVYLVVFIARNYPSSDRKLRAMLCGSIALIAAAGIETLFCKLMPVLRAPEAMFRVSPLIYLFFNAFLAVYFLNRLSRAGAPEEPRQFEESFAQYGLTNREKEVAALLLEGCRNKAIGKRLYISEATVKTHILNIYQKTGVNSRVQLANKFFNR